MATTTTVSELTINYLTQAQYDEAATAGTIDVNQIYMTPSSEGASSAGGSSDGNTTYSLSKSGSTITLTGSDGSTSSVSDSNTTYTHPSYTSRTGVPTTNQTPAFGGTFTVTQPVSDSTGHITSMTSRTITIPSTTATTSKAGLMSASDKSKLDGLSSSGSGTLEYENISLAIGAATNPTVTIGEENSRYYPSLGMVFISINISFQYNTSAGTDFTGSSRPIRFQSSAHYPAMDTPLNCCYNSTLTKELRAWVQAGNSNSYGIGLYAVDDISAYDNFYISGWYIVK